MQRFFLPGAAFQEGQVRFPEEIAHQIHSVLRLQPGDPVVALDNSGWEYRVVLRTVRPKEAAGEIVAKNWNEREPRLRVCLLQSVLKGDHFEWVLQKGTELGVSGFVPLLTRRTIVPKSGDFRPGKLERWRKIITEAAEQSGRGRLPELLVPRRLEQAAAGLEPGALSLIAWEKQTGGSLRAALRERLASGPISAVNLMIGPEGGFEAAEVELAAQCGVQPVTLGRRILRAETAGITAAALILYELGEME